MKQKTLLSAILLFLGACATDQHLPIWSFYDQCSPHTSTFKEMAECGKNDYSTYCNAHTNCNANDTFFVKYTDSLVVSVKSGDLTEAEAQRKWIEYRSSQVNAYQQQRAIATSRPVTCLGGPMMMNCF